MIRNIFDYLYLSVHIKYLKIKLISTKLNNIIDYQPVFQKIRNITTGTCLRHSPPPPLSEIPISETPISEILDIKTPEIEPYKEVDITTFIESLMKIM